MRAPFLSIKALQKLYQSNNSPKLLDCTFVLKGPPSGFEIYKKEHIPTALHFDIDKCATVSPFPHTFPTEEIFNDYVKKLGIGNRNDHLVFYASAGIFPAMRVWYMFKAFGHNPDMLQILEGGVTEWKKIGLEVESGENTVKEANSDYNAQFDSTRVYYYEDIVNRIQGKGEFVIVDARSSGRFSGEEPEPREGLSSGHIPTSVNIPFMNLLQIDTLGTSMKDKDELERIFQAQGLKPNQKLVFSCGSGLTACVLARAADLIGYKNYAIYDGSWVEYASKKESIIEKSY